MIVVVFLSVVLNMFLVFILFRFFFQSVGWLVSTDVHFAIVNRTVFIDTVVFFESR